MREHPGLALTDVAISMGVVAILLSAVTVSTGILTSSRTARQLDDIRQLRYAVTQWVELGGRTTYTGIDLKALEAANLIPTSALLTPWGGPVALSPRTSTTYRISVCGLPSQARGSLRRQLTKQALEIIEDQTCVRLTFR